MDTPPVRINATRPKPLVQSSGRPFPRSNITLATQRIFSGGSVEHRPPRSRVLGITPRPAVPLTFPDARTRFSGLRSKASQNFHDAGNSRFTKRSLARARDVSRKLPQFPREGSTIIPSSSSHTHRLVHIKSSSSMRSIRSFRTARILTPQLSSDAAEVMSAPRLAAGGTALPYSISVSASTTPIHSMYSSHFSSMSQYSRSYSQPVFFGNATAPPMSVLPVSNSVLVEISFPISTATFFVHASSESLSLSSGLSSSYSCDLVDCSLPKSAEFRELDAESRLTYLERDLKKHLEDVEDGLPSHEAVTRSTVIRRVNHVTNLRIVEVQQQRLTAWSCSAMVDYMTFPPGVNRHDPIPCTPDRARKHTPIAKPVSAVDTSDDPTPKSPHQKQNSIAPNHITEERKRSVSTASRYQREGSSRPSSARPKSIPAHGFSQPPPMHLQSISNIYDATTSMMSHGKYSSRNRNSHMRSEPSHAVQPSAAIKSGSIFGKFAVRASGRRDISLASPGEQENAGKVFNVTPRYLFH